MAVLAPLVIMVQRPAFFSMFERRRLGNTLLVLSVPVVVTALVFTHSQDPLIFCMFPTLLLVAFRLGLPGTVVDILLVTLMAIAFHRKRTRAADAYLRRASTLASHRYCSTFCGGRNFHNVPRCGATRGEGQLKNSLSASEARYRNLAHVDELTGLPNRRAFNLRLENAWTDASSSGKRLALLILDADLFKQYNDDVGHLGGDACLRSIARVVAGVVDGTNGIAARIGGEEFAVILPDTTQLHAEEVAEEIRLSIEELSLAHSSSPYGVQTVSIGVAVEGATGWRGSDRSDEVGGSGTVLGQVLRAESSGLHLDRQMNQPLFAFVMRRGGLGLRAAVASPASPKSGNPKSANLDARSRTDCLRLLSPAASPISVETPSSLPGRESLDARAGPGSSTSPVWAFFDFWLFRQICKLLTRLLPRTFDSKPINTPLSL